MNLNKGTQWEKKAKKYLESKGFTVIRLDTIRTKHLPDFMILREGQLMFVECKSSTSKEVTLKSLRSLNPRQYDRIKSLGQSVPSVYFILEQEVAFVICPISATINDPEDYFA